MMRLRSPAILIGCVSLALILPAHGATIAHWTFSEGSGQSVANSDGSSTMALQLGSTSGVDANDPTWVTGGVNGEPNNTYLLKSGWTAADELALALIDTSYTIETIISLDSLPDGASFGDKAMGLVFYRDTADSAGGYKYLLRLYRGSTADSMWVGLYNSDNGNILAYNTNAANDGDTLTATLNRKYYVAAIFDKNTGSVQVLVRDLVTGQQASKSTTIVANSALSAAPNVLFYAAAESPARSLDGTMHDLRISDSVVAEQDRLYNLPEPTSLGLLGLGSLAMTRTRSSVHH